MESGRRLVDGRFGWRRRELIGVGGFGAVYKAATTPTCTENDSSVPPLMAVKTVEYSEAASLLKEAVILSSLHQQQVDQDEEGSSYCPHIIGYYGHDFSIESPGSSKKRPFYNMFLEFATHGSLADQIRESPSGRLPESQAQIYTRSILLGLDHIHCTGYVHCDIKPANILLAYSWSPSSCGKVVPKIADFGLAKPVGKLVKKRGDGIRGTPIYMAPESLHSHEYERACDVWALGCVVLEMLTGKPPWLQWGVDEPFSWLLDRIGYSDEIPFMPDALSIQAKDFIGKCFIKDPLSRWSIDMLLEHPFVAGNNNVSAEAVCTTMDSAVSTSYGILSSCRKRRKIGDAEGMQGLPPIIA